MKRITLIGFGEVGQTLADDLLARGGVRITAWDVLFDDRETVPACAARERPAVHVAGNAADAVRGADLVVCAVTAASALDAAGAVAAGIGAGVPYLDLNSASPGTKQTAAGIIDAAGGSYLEAAVMAPIGPKRIASPILLGGARAAELAPGLVQLGFTGVRAYADTVGPASATKMCRSVMIKGIEALLAESMLAARHYGVEDDVLDSLSDLLPVGDWHALARYMISRSIEHGVRRAEEMREVARTVQEAGIEPWMTRACVQRQEWAPRHWAALEHETIAPFLDAMRAARDNSQDPPAGHP
jgi:3-hydroxyisobutyrate dehydrogenase-like beta-hydroxyacid dehydrogenase